MAGRRRLTVRLLAAGLALLVGGGAIVGCGESDDATVVRVFAAASLTDAFDEIAAAFEKAGPDGVRVDLSYAGSSALREQILDGAPAHVFASADEANMEAVVAGGEADDPRTFARNRLQIVVPAGNPANVTGLDDLADASLLVGLCAPEVPCGRLARQVLTDAGVAAAPDTEEADVRALLTKVADGELDLGLVYATDVLAGGETVEGIDIAGPSSGATAYPIATVSAGREQEAAQAFVAFVLSDAGQAILAAHGFGAP